MAVRGRSSSDAPAKLVRSVTEKVGLSISSGPEHSQEQTAQHRASGLGALPGYVDGIGTGIIYGLLRSQFGKVPEPLAVVGEGLSAMAASDVPLIVAGVSDPKTWGISGWIADGIPHLVYGLVIVAVFEAITDAECR